MNNCSLSNSDVKMMQPQYTDKAKVYSLKKCERHDRRLIDVLVGVVSKIFETLNAVMKQVCIFCHMGPKKVEHIQKEEKSEPIIDPYMWEGKPIVNKGKYVEVIEQKRKVPPPIPPRPSRKNIKEVPVEVNTPIIVEDQVPPPPPPPVVKATTGAPPKKLVGYDAMFEEIRSNNFKLRKVDPEALKKPESKVSSVPLQTSLMDQVKEAMKLRREAIDSDTED